MHSSFAAVTLALTVAAATIGTIWQTEAPPGTAGAGHLAPCAAGPTEAAQAPLHPLLRRTERGLHRIAGLPTP